MEKERLDYDRRLANHQLHSSLHRRTPTDQPPTSDGADGLVDRGRYFNKGAASREGLAARAEQPEAALLTRFGHADGVSDSRAGGAVLEPLSRAACVGAVGAMGLQVSPRIRAPPALD